MKDIIHPYWYRMPHDLLASTAVLDAGSNGADAAAGVSDETAGPPDLRPRVVVMPEFLKLTEIGM